jgi:fatty-acyl-CoA synthase
VLGCYACINIGAIAVPLNIRFRAELLHYVLTHSKARVLIAESELFAKIEAIRPSLKEVEQYYLTSADSEFDGVNRNSAPKVAKKWEKINILITQ